MDGHKGQTRLAQHGPEKILILSRGLLDEPSVLEGSEPWPPGPSAAFTLELRGASLVGRDVRRRHIRLSFALAAIVGLATGCLLLEAKPEFGGDTGTFGAEGEGEGAGACDAYLAALASCEGMPQETIDQMEEAMDAGTATEEVCKSYLDAFDSAGGCDAYGG